MKYGRPVLVCFNITKQFSKMYATATEIQQFYRRVLPSTCISFSSDEGKKIFAEALAAGQMNSYFGLAAQFRTQDEPAYCGLTSLVMALNTLEVDPGRVWKGPWRWFHENMLDCCVPIKIVEEQGITMDQFACLASCNSLLVKLQRADQSSIQQFRTDLRETCSKEGQVLVASYSRSALGQTGQGHFSPLAGYHPGRDLALVMDTARFKYPPHWVQLDDLWKAMLEIDVDTSKCRGYMLLTKAGVQPLVVFRLSSSLSVDCTVDPNLKMFLQTWQPWLKNQVSCSDVWKATADEIVKCWKNLSRPLLITQLDKDFYAATDSKEHASAACFAQTVITTIERMPLYDYITKALEEECLTDSLRMKDTGHTWIACACKAQTSNSPTVINCSGCKPYSSDSSKSCIASRILTAHSIAMLILAWPYQRLKDGSYEDVLSGLVTASLVNIPKAVTNEIMQIQHQLSKVLSFKQRKQEFDDSSSLEQQGVGSH